MGTSQGDSIEHRLNHQSLTFDGRDGVYTDSSARAYARARTYNKKYGRWLTVDRFFPTQPAYRYAGGNPATHSDPEGVFILPILIVIGVGALIGGCGRSKKPKFFYCDEWDEQTRDQTKCGEMCEDVYMKGGAGFQADCLDCCREIDPNAPPQKCYAQCSEIAGRFSAPCQCDESKRGKNKPPQGPPF